MAPTDVPVSANADTRIADALALAIETEELIITPAEFASLQAAIQNHLETHVERNGGKPSLADLEVFCRAVIFGARWRSEAEGRIS